MRETKGINYNNMQTNKNERKNKRKNETKERKSSPYDCSRLPAPNFSSSFQLKTPFQLQTSNSYNGK
jgi:hypothetical protein